MSCSIPHGLETGFYAIAEYLTLEPLGSHCIVELYDCPAGPLNDESFVKNAVREAAKQGWATLLHEVSHRFHPQGVTALGLISESHIAIHTWPECGYVAADVFTCGDHANAQRACEYLIRTFRAGRHSLTKLVRGTEALRAANSNPPPADATADLVEETVS